jgi:hypothetical protein
MLKKIIRKIFISFLQSIKDSGVAVMSEFLSLPHAPSTRAAA